MNYRDLLRIFRENSHILFTQVIDKLFYFVFWTLLARSLSPDNYGSIIIVFAFANLMAVIFGFGFPVHIQREAAISRDNANGVFSSVFFSNILLFIPSALISSVIFFIVYPSLNENYILLLVVLLAMISSELLLGGVLKGQQKYKTIFSVTAIVRIITALLMFMFYFSGKNSLYIIYSFIAGNVIFILTLSYISGQFPNAIKFSNFNLRSLARLISVVFPLWLATIFNFLYDRIDVFLISKLVSFEQLSLYSIAYGIMKSSTLAFGFLLVGGFTKASSFNGNRDLMRSFILKYSALFLLISIVIFSVLFVFAGNILVFFYTDKYSGSAPVLQILAFAIIPLSLNNLTGIALNGAGLYKQNLYVTIFGFLFNLAANIIVIPIYGITGAAFITILTELIVLSGDALILKNKSLV